MRDNRWCGKMRDGSPLSEKVSSRTSLPWVDDGLLYGWRRSRVVVAPRISGLFGILLIVQRTLVYFDRGFLYEAGNSLLLVGILKSRLKLTIVIFLSHKCVIVSSAFRARAN